MFEIVWQEQVVKRNNFYTFVKNIRMTKHEIKDYWVNQSEKVLKGRVIKSVRYLSDDEMELMGWYKRPICFELDNGTLCIPSMDDEGNDGGSLFYQEKGKELDVLPVI